MEKVLITKAKEQKRFKELSAEFIYYWEESFFHLAGW